MSTRERNTRMRAVHRESGRTIEPNGDVLTIAVVNNMPDFKLCYGTPVLWRRRVQHRKAAC